MPLRCFLVFLALPFSARAESPRVATFSIVACDPKTGELGVAVQSRFFGVGAVVPWAKAGVSAIASQSFANTTYGPDGLKLLADGLAPEDVVTRLTEGDTRRAVRQLGQRIIEALQAGQAAGGDKRGMQSAALLVVREGWGYAGLNDRYRDLRVDDHAEPIAELQRIYELHRRLFPGPAVK